MNTNQTYLLFFAPFRIWASFASNLGELALASSQVISRRSQQMLSPAQMPTPAYQRELALMSQEKFAAAAESVQAMGLGYMNLAPRMAMLALRQMAAGLSPFVTAMPLNPFQFWSRQFSTANETLARSAAAANQVSRSMEDIASRGLKPIHSRVVANAKRLKRKTR